MEHGQQERPYDALSIFKMDSHKTIYELDHQHNGSDEGKQGRKPDKQQKHSCEKEDGASRQEIKSRLAAFVFGDSADGKKQPKKVLRRVITLVIS